MYGCILSPVDERDYQLKDFITRGTRPEVFMHENQAPVLNQGSVGSCVAHAIATMFWHFENMDYSTDDIYHDRESTDHQGSGMITREALKKGQKRGVVLKKYIPTNTEYPSDTVKALIKYLTNVDIHKNKIGTYVRCADMDDICEAVYQNGAAVFVLDVKTSFRAHYLKNESNWVLPVPSDKETSSGYHCVCVVGYNKDGIVIQNSWGEHWGYNGLAVLPWDYPVLEAWSVTDLVKDWDVIKLIIDSKEVFINGETVQIDVPAQIVNSRTLVPIRFIAEALGCEVEYTDEGGVRMVTITKERS